MKTSRSIVIPIVFGTTIVLSLLAYLAYGIGRLEFTYAVREQDHQFTIPAIGEIFKSAYPYFWILPTLGCVAGILLVFKKETSTVIVAWYVATFAIAGISLLCLTILTYYLLSTNFLAGG